ncbi:MAG: hypothetical protein IPL26_05945 [Leptospiraceae bacterium]|nr:hypothetical protein [Leptospiraceae bacterium]
MLLFLSIPANSLSSTYVQWGNGTPGTGTSKVSAGANAVNGSIDNTAPF